MPLFLSFSLLEMFHSVFNVLYSWHTLLSQQIPQHVGTSEGTSWPSWISCTAVAQCARTSVLRLAVPLTLLTCHPLQSGKDYVKYQPLPSAQDMGSIQNKHVVLRVWALYDWTLGCMFVSAEPVFCFCRLQKDLCEENNPLYCHGGNYHFSENVCWGWEQLECAVSAIVKSFNFAYKQDISMFANEIFIVRWGWPKISYVLSLFFLY